MGGLARFIPVTCIACIIAALSISGAPGFNGFVSKGMVIASAVGAHADETDINAIDKKWGNLETGW